MATKTDSQFHILAVDDSIIDRMIVEKLLKASSYRVTSVDSGSKALEVLGFHEDEKNVQESDVHLIITDYSMPGMTGYDLLKKIKESASLREIPVVIMSSEDNPSRISRCLEEGADEFILKPVKLADVIKLGVHILRYKNRSVSPERSGMTETESELEIRPQRDDEAQGRQDQPLQQMQKQSLAFDSYKRKVTEDVSSPERTKNKR